MRKTIILLLLIGFIISSKPATMIKTFYIGKEIYDYRNNQLIRLAGSNDLIGFRIGGAYFVSDNFSKTINSRDMKAYDWYVYGGLQGFYSRPEKPIKGHAKYDMETDLLQITFTLPEFYDIGLFNQTDEVPQWYKDGSIDWYTIEIEKKFIRDIL